jgi:flavodoxin
MISLLLAGCGDSGISTSTGSSTGVSTATSTNTEIKSSGTNAKSNKDVSSNSNTKSTKGTGKSSASNSSKSGLKPNSTDKGYGKVLIAYFSLTGNTKQVVDVIKEKTGADIFEIKTVENYLRKDIEEVAKKQINEGYVPKMANSVKIDDYDLIFVGSPVWWFTTSLPVKAFLKECDLKNKKVVPFCTYGSVEGDFFEDFSAECSSKNVLNGIGFTESDLNDMDKVSSKIDTWLKEIKG